MLSVIEKADEDVLDFDFDFSKWLATGDAIDDVTATIEDSTVETTTLAVDTTSNTATMVKVWLSGGEPGESAVLKVVVETTVGRTKEKSYRIRVKER